MNRGGRGTGRGRAGAAAGSSGTTRPSATPTPGRTPSTTRGGRGASAPATARFRPKNIRRDEAERDSIARQEEKKASERLAAERRATRGKFRSKRSRGDAMGSRGGRGGAMTASGTLSGLGSSGGRFGGGGGGFGGGGGGGGAGGFRAGGSSRVKGEGPAFREARDANREARINADRLHVMEPDEELDSEDEAMLAHLNSQPNVLPMGIYRKAHKEAEVVVATTAELEAAEKAGEEESLWVDDNSREATQPIPEQPPEEGVWDTKKTIVKKEEAEDEMDLDVPDSKEKESKPKVEIKIKKGPPKDPEDRVIEADLDLLRSELGSVTIGEDGETQTQGPADKDGRMYLFQFPPLLPPLKSGKKPKSKVKADPESEEFNMADAPPAQSDTPVDLTAEEADAKANEEDDPEDKNGFMSSLLTQGGMVGKMNVRKSGKVELDWGGRILEMSPATGMNFLTTAVILEENDEKPQPGVNGGESIGMGKIMGRFVLAPVWSEEEEWEVDPKDLEVVETIQD